MIGLLIVSILLNVVLFLVVCFLRSECKSWERTACQQEKYATAVAIEARRTEAKLEDAAQAFSNYLLEVSPIFDLKDTK